MFLFNYFQNIFLAKNKYTKLFLQSGKKGKVAQFNKVDRLGG